MKVEFEGRILSKYDFTIAISSLVFINDNDDKGQFINSQITDIFEIFKKDKLIHHGYSSLISDCYKRNVIEHNMSTTISKIKVVKEVIRILFSNNQLLTTQWVITAKQVYIDLNNLVFKYTI